jgi:hypothetical protein
MHECMNGGSDQQQQQQQQQRVCTQCQLSMNAVASSSAPALSPPSSLAGSQQDYSSRIGSTI